MFGRIHAEWVGAGRAPSWHVERRFAEADETVGRDHQVIEDGDVKQHSSFACFVGKPDVVRRGRWVA